MNSPAQSMGPVKVSVATVRMIVIASVFLATLIFAAAVLHLSRESPPSVYEPAGYINRVRDLAGSGVLQYFPNSGSAGQPWGEIVLAAQDLKPHQRAFYEESMRLRRDLAVFNETGGGMFRVASNGVVEVDRYTHNLRLPYPARSGWKGSFSFGGDPVRALAGEALTLGFAVGDDRQSASAKEVIALSFSEWFPREGVAEPAFARAVGFDLLGPAGTGAAFRLRSKGHEVLLEAADPNFARVVLNGAPVNLPGGEEIRKQVEPRRQGLPPNTYRLENGDRIRIVLKQGETVFRFGNFEGGLISRSWLENGREVSAIDPELAREMPYLAELHEAVNRHVRTRASPRSQGQTNVRFTFDRGLHAGLQDKLARYVRDFDRNRSALSGVAYEPAAIAVVDAFTGDVLAIPSYPTIEEIERFETMLQTGGDGILNEAKLRMLRHNQNFPSVPIGSTAKPLFAIAIWETHPALRRLAIDEPAGSLSKIYGRHLASPLATVSAARHVTPEIFLGQSSNAYAVSLYFLTLADQSSFTVTSSGQVQIRPPATEVDFSRYIRGELIVGGLLRPPGELPAHDKLAECFGIDLAVDHADDGSGRFDGTILAPLLKALDAETEPLPPAFWPTVPYRTQLDLQNVDVVRSELVSMLVGGMTNRWSNLKLAEAFARIGTGRKVEMRMLQLAGEKTRKGRLQDFDRLPVSAAVLDLAHDGMAQALDSGGTAARLHDPLRREMDRLAKRGLKLKALGKTGTARRVGPREGHPERECAAFALYLELQNSAGKPLSAASTTIYLQDRAQSRHGSRNSAVAVELAGNILPDVVGWLEAQPSVREYLGGRRQTVFQR